jgi:hypothetical protein
MNGPNKHFSIILGRKDLPLANTLTLWAHSKVMNVNMTYAFKSRKGCYEWLNGHFHTCPCIRQSTIWLIFIWYIYSKKWVRQSLSNSLFILQDIYKLYRQVLTSIQSSLLLLKQGRLDKFRLAYSPQKYTQRNTTF